MTLPQTSPTSLTIKYMLFISGIVFLVSYLSFVVLKNYMQEQYVSMQINNIQVKADRFKQFLRNNELIARLSGDEFCLLIYGNIDEFEINNLTKRLKNECIQEIVLDGKTFNLDMTLGIAMFPDNGTSYGELISCADQKMYAEKNLKKNENLI